MSRRVGRKTTDHGRRQQTSDLRPSDDDSRVVSLLALYSLRMELRDLPSVDALAAALGKDFDLPDAVVVSIAKSQVDAAREALVSSGDADDPEGAARQRLSDIEAAKPRAVINATGVLLHTNLGRAQAPNKVSATSAEISQSASNVEIDIRTGRRSKRHDYLGSLLPAVTGAEAGFAVNNNAGALLLALASVAGSGGRIAVSRGELIEIGGSFRLPDLMKASGAELVEVGTTNRTRASDYAQVVASVNGILKVHPSNYRIDGFKEETSYTDLADIAHDAGIPLIADIGSGLMDEMAPWLGDLNRSWLRNEPGVTRPWHVVRISFCSRVTSFSVDHRRGSSSVRARPSVTRCRTRSHERSGSTVRR